MKEKRKPWSKLCTNQHGWFLRENKISKYVSDLFLWNSLNHKKIKLPLPLLQHNGTVFGNCVLSCPPTANDEICSIFLFSSHSPSIFYYKLKDKEIKQWTQVRFYDEIVRVLAMTGRSPMKEERSIFEDPVYCNGCLYAGMWTSSSFILVVIEKLQPNGFTIDCTSHPMVKFQSNIIRGFEQVINQLIGFNNVLFRIIILHALNRVAAVFVYKFDCSQRVWEKVESIKDMVFFITNRLESPFVCQASNPEIEGGRVYIALKNCNCFYIYNIEDKSLVTSPPFSNLSKKQSYSRCFMPDTGKDIRKAHQIREKVTICNAVYLKDTGDKYHNEYALPLDVFEVIAKSINNVFDYLHFRASNKLLRLAAPPIQWKSYSSMSMSRFDDLSMCPLFVFSEKDNVFTFVHPKHGLNYKNIINFPQGKRRNSVNFCLEICCSKDGWLLLVAIQNGFRVFFNPFTKEVLPPIRHIRINNIRCVGMSHSPTSSECVTVELNKEKEGHITAAYVHLLREDAFDIIDYEVKDFSLYNISPAFHNGLFYFLSITGKLGVIEVTREKISWKILEKLQAPCSTCFNNFIVECDGSLLSVFESPFAKGVQVFKLNESTMRWMKVENLKNHMLFVSKTTSFSAMANIPGMGNKIYFPRFYGKSVVFYSLETNNYHTFENDKVMNFHHMREYLNGTWIQPRWH